MRHLIQEHSSQQEDKEELVNAIVNHESNAAVMLFFDNRPCHVFTRLAVS